MSSSSSNKVFAPAIFFIAFREALEASLVIGILSGMLEKIVDVKQSDSQGRNLVRKLRKYIFFGALTGLLIAFAIGAAFLAVFYTQTTDLYGRSEELWEGIFNIIAVVLITPMSLAILRADRSRAKWRRKLSKAFAGLHAERQEAVSTIMSVVPHSHRGESNLNGDAEQGHGQELDAIVAAPAAASSSTSEKHDAPAAAPASHQSSSRVQTLYRLVTRPFNSEARGATAIFVIPFVTTLREGLEGVVFIGGVSLGLPATSIPLPAILGLFVGLLCGFIVFKAGSFTKVRAFLVFSTCFLLVIAAGMFSRAVYYLQFYQYVRLVGDAAAESGSGPGSYNALNYVWHLDCCNPESKQSGGSGWAILNSLFGWNNTATVGSIVSYCMYWLAVIAYLAWSHISEEKQRQKRQTSRLQKQQERSAQSVTSPVVEKEKPPSVSSNLPSSSLTSPDEKQE